MSAMQQELDALKQNLNAAEDMRSQVAQMFDDGLLKQNSDGKYEAVTDPNESMAIRSEIANGTKQKLANQNDGQIL